MDVLAKGFRPFFLLASGFAALVVPVWLLVLDGVVAPSGLGSGVLWHAHEMVHGFTAAVLAGFLLTAVGNWTGRETLTGPALGGLAAVWAAGRVASWTGSWAAIDLLFLPLLALAIGRSLAAARDRRNVVFPALLAVLWATNVAVWADALGWAPGAGVPANRAAIHVVTAIVLVVTGRIVPTFTRNATGAAVANAPALDRIAVVATLAVGVLQVLSAPAVEAVVASVGAAAVVLRARRWGLVAALGQPLLWVLHAGHAAVAAGLALEALAALGLVGRSPALHALTVGSIGALTLGMMARVALGHTGRALHAAPPVVAAFVAVLAAAVLRVAGPIVLPGWTVAWWWAAGLAWTAAFAAYVGAFAPILLAPRADGRPG